MPRFGEVDAGSHHEGLKRIRCFFIFTCDMGVVMRLFHWLILPLLAIPAIGGETAWQEVAPGVHLRLVTTGEVRSDGRTLAGIEIDMPEATKTYWQVPGDTGLPLEVDLSGSTGVTGHQVLWPYPAVEKTADYLDYVYRGHTVIPLVLNVEAGAAHLSASLVLGICSEICVPAQAKLSLPLRDARPDRANALRIRQALADVPMPWPDDQPVFGEPRLVPEHAAVALPVEVEDLEVHSLIATFEDGVPLLGVPHYSPDGHLVQIPVLDMGDMDELVGREVRLTFMTSEGAYQTHRTIGPPG